MKLMSEETLVPGYQTRLYTRLFIYTRDYKVKYYSPSNMLSERNIPEQRHLVDGSMVEVRPLDYYLQNGKKIEAALFYDIVSFSTEDTYEGLNNKFRVRLPYRKGRFFKLLKKGVMGNLKMDRYNDEKALKKLKDLDQKQLDENWVNPKDSHIGYLDDYKIKEDFVELKFVGAGALLEKEGEAEYLNMPRQEILQEVIKEAGLDPFVDFTGLPNDVISYTTRQKSEAEEQGREAGDYDDTRSTYDLCVDKDFPLSKCVAGANNFDSLYKPFANVKRDYYKKAKELGNADNVLKWFRQNYHWKGTGNDNRDPNPDATFHNIRSNCADSNRLLCAMLQSVGVKSVLVHDRPYGEGHYWVSAKLDGVWHFVDTCYWSHRGENSTNTYGV